MTNRPDIIRAEEAEDTSVKELLREAETSWYGDSAFFGAMAHCPEIFRNTATIFESFGQRRHINTELMELMRLKVAEVHQCAYCATVRTLEVRESVKHKEDAVFGEIDNENLTKREFVAVSLAEYMSENPHRITDDFFSKLQDVFSEAEIIELLLFISLEVGLDRFCIALELQPTDESAYPNQVDYPLENPRPKNE